jgi:hypothetical protein
MVPKERRLDGLCACGLLGFFTIIKRNGPDAVWDKFICACPTPKPDWGNLGGYD